LEPMMTNDKKEREEEEEIEDNLDSEYWNNNSWPEVELIENEHYSSWSY
jgi:hypothetical protein